jgi:hypothetical protein
VFPPCRRLIDNHHYGADGAKRWRKARRLAHPDLLQFYFEKSLPPEILRGHVVHEIFENLGDEDALRSMISAQDETMVEHVCSRLEDYEDDYPPAVVEPALVVFFEQIQDCAKAAAGLETPGLVSPSHASLYAS